MNAWDNYAARIAAIGGTKRGSTLLREKRTLTNKLPESLSYHTVTVYDKDHGYNIDRPEIAAGAFQQNVAIINSDNLNEKYIFSLPDEDIRHGDLIHWMGNYWLVTERDANTTVYTKCKMIQCNHLLKWVSDEHKVCEQWCIIEDGTKYLTGEYEDRNFVASRGDSRIAMTIARNNQTLKFTRDYRFLIDDPESPRKLAYTLSKPLKLGWSFNQQGAFKFVLQEVNSTDNDELNLGIADYYKHFPKETTVDPEDDSNNSSGVDSDESAGKKVWL